MAIFALETRTRAPLFVVAVASFVFVGANGCSSSSGSNGPDETDSGSPSDATGDVHIEDVGVDSRDARPSDTSSDLGADVGSEAGADADAGTDAIAASPTIYASTNTSLYTFDPSSASLTKIGDFDCIGGVGADTSMTDIAVDAAGALYGVSAKNAYALTVTGATVHCATTIPLLVSATFYGLSIVPAGVLDTKEVLLAATTAGELWSIDRTSGTLVEHGTFGTVPATDPGGHTYANAGKPWELSGDIVFGIGAGGSTVGFATVRDCPSPPSSSGCNTVDTLVEIDPTALSITTTGSIVKSIRGQIVRASTCSDTASGYGSFYGLALGSSAAFGFDHAGGVVSIDFSTGAGCSVLAGTMAFGGAGVTESIVTSAP
jgi:hypothetical protein